MMVSVMDSSRDALPMTVGSSQLSSDEEDDCLSSPGSPQFSDHAELMAAAMGDEVTAQLAAAGWQSIHGPVGMAAAAAIVSSKKRKRPHSFETNPSIRKRQQNRLLRKLRQTIEEFATRVGQQAVVLVATPGKPNPSFKVFGAKPLEDVVRSLRGSILDELEIALAQQAPPPNQEDPSLYELPPLIIDGIPTPVEKMTQAQLRAFIPLMLKYSTGRGKPGWGRESTRPLWWPKELPWANVRMDARSEEEKQKISWTHALRQIVINCYKYHGREDLLPAFTEEDERSLANGEEPSPVGLAAPVPSESPTVAVHSTQTPSTGQSVGVLKFHPSSKSVSTSPGASSPPVSSAGTVVSVVTNSNTISSPSPTVPATTSSTPMTQQVTQYAPTTVLQTISNPDGTMSFIHVDPNSPIITLSDGTTAQVQGVTTITDHSEGTVHTVQTLEVGSPDGVTLDLNGVTEAALINPDGQLIVTGEDGHEYALKLCNVDKLWQGHGTPIDKNPRAASSQRSLAPSNTSGVTPVSLRASGYPVNVSGMITVPVPASMYQTMVANIQHSDGTMQMVPVPKVEPVTSTGAPGVETISVGPGMHQIMTMNGAEPQVVHVFSLKDTNSLSKSISTEMKVEDSGEVIAPD